MAVTNLNQYYQSIGKSLPSVGDRSGIYQNLGLGSSGSYQGTASQNNALLGALTSGKGSTSGGNAAPTSSPSSEPSLGGGGLQNYINQATSESDPQYQKLVGMITTTGNATQKSYNDLAASTLASTPIVQQMYGNLSAELDASKAVEDTNSQQIGEQNIGSARAANAAAGLDSTAQGAFAAPITAAQNKLTYDLNTIANKYNTQQTTLVSNMNASLGQLQDRAANYTAQGNAAAAQTATQLVSLAQSHQQYIQTLANDLYNAESDREKQAFTEKMQMADLAYKQKSLELQEQSMAESARHNRVSESQSGAGAPSLAFPTAVNGVTDNAIKQLQKGVSWGTVFTQTKNKLIGLGMDPKDVNNQIDSSLNKDYWSKSGAYSRYYNEANKAG